MIEFNMRKKIAEWIYPMSYEDGWDDGYRLAYREHLNKKYSVSYHLDAIKKIKQEEASIASNQILAKRKHNQTNKNKRKVK